MLNGVLAKVLSELTLATYPVFIKIVDISFIKKLIYRFFAFCLISIFFCDINVLKKYLFNKDGLLLSFYTLIHIIASYKGYELLDGGVANSILYIYPLIILYFNNKKYIIIYFLILVGLILLSLDHFIKKNKINSTKKDVQITYVKGFFCMLIAAITEALIYFSVLNIKTTNNWNHIFISYFFGLILVISFFIINIKIEHESLKENLVIDKKNLIFLLFNVFAALFGYYLRFYSMDKINYKLYAILSYLGIFMTYFYSYMFNNEKLTYLNFIGSLIIILSNVYLLFQPKND
jgi:drug/metabolite transporter (DMT)-like permease